MKSNQNLYPQLLVLLLISGALSFNLVAKPAAPTRPIQRILSTATIQRTAMTSSKLFGGLKRLENSSLFSTEDPVEPEETEASKEVQSPSDTTKDDDDEARGITRTVLLTVPLFCKFVIVLMIKFVTDLIVFPLLWLYKLAGVVKRRILRLFGKGGLSEEKVNGSS